MTLVGILLLPEAAWSQLPLACGETQIASGDSGHHALEFFTFHANGGDRFSFLTESGDANVAIFVGRDNTFEQAPIINGSRAWFCDWTAPDSGDFLVILEINGIGGWQVSLTLFCATQPAECSEVPVAPTTWTLVKSLFR